MKSELGHEREAHVVDDLDGFHRGPVEPPHLFSLEPVADLVGSDHADVATAKIHGQQEQAE
jgi:hypothetical protein